MPADNISSRRELVINAGRIASALSLTTLLTPTAAFAAVDVSPLTTPPGDWDLSWVTTLATATDRAVFDWPSLGDPADPQVVYFAERYLNNCQAAYAPGKYDARAVLNIRTQAIAAFSDPKDQNLDVKRITDDWHMDIKAKPGFDIAVQTIVFQPGSTSGWHRHPGPVFIQVVSGTMTFYMSDDPTCSPTVRTAGQSYLDLGEHAHIARNEGTTPAQNLVTYFAPPGAALRIDADSPGNCPF